MLLDVRKTRYFARGPFIAEKRPQTTAMNLLANSFESYYVDDDNIRNIGPVIVDAEV
jgi:hypothetical protein